MADSISPLLPGWKSKLLTPPKRSRPVKSRRRQAPPEIGRRESEACRHKVAWPEMASAMKEIPACEYAANRRLRAYHCRVCHRWHLTSRRQ